MAKYTIKPMTREDLAVAIEWAAAEGWNPGIHDISSFYAADPNGFLMGWLDDQAIAAISVVKYGASFGFLGLYIVRPGFRGHGYGWRLWQAGMETLKGRTVGLDGVVEQQSKYRKTGFQMAHRNIRYEGFGDGQALLSSAYEFIPLSSLPIEQVIEYDRSCFPSDRSAFLRSWLDQPESVAVGILMSSSLVGYGVLRPCREGFKIGPLFSDTPIIADNLFQHLRAQVPKGIPFYLDVPEVNKKAMELAQTYCLTNMFETARMYFPEAPELPMDRIFGITTFELG